MAENDDVLIRALVKEQRRNRNERVEPAARLIDRLGDKVCGEIFLKDLLVLKRIVPLRKRHRTRVEPAVDDLGHAVHFLTALLARERDCVDVRTMQFDIGGAVRLKLTQLRNRSDGVLVPAGAFPDIERCTPVAIAADAPILHMLDPVAETTVANRLRNPVDRIVVCNKCVAHRRHADEP